MVHDTLIETAIYRPTDRGVTNYNGYDGRGDISYTGKERDATGLYYFNARYYDPSVGRFITEDPARNGLNWFVYCNNNPLSRTDPSGLWASIGAQNAAGDDAEDRRQYRAYLDEERYSYEGYRHQDQNQQQRQNTASPTNELIFISIMQKLGEEYISGVNDCDIWIEDAFSNAGINLSDLWGPSQSTSIDTHMKIIANELSKIPAETWDVFFQNRDHAGIIRINNDGSIDVFHNGRNPGDIWESRAYHYNSVKEFEIRWSGGKQYWHIY
jgi:RHS repeat-associated protein